MRIDRRAFDQKMGQHAEAVRELANDLIEQAAIIIEGCPLNKGLLEPKRLADEVRSLKIPAEKQT